MPEAPSTSADDADGKVWRKAQAATTTTMVSRDSVTATTWLQSEDAAPAIGADSEVASLPPTSSGTPDSAEQTSGAERTAMEAYQAPPCSDTRASVDSRYSVRVDYSTGCSIGNDTRKRRQSSTMASASEGEPNLQQESREGEDSDLPTTALAKMRKGSFQFGEAMGSFINGAYWNADHKPRRDPSVVRMRGILDRLQPPRAEPGEGQDIHTAFTGARPITPIDQYNARTKRPGPPSDTCSEDGRRHKCVQHETDTPPDRG
ncbi:hypothetical protein VPNG_09724 [Cytospora leucostoma]|uniref:Uncharacterized protein n=1 Tax=Cytospora leucostoma TaxID=1230097 RepID=A0A423VKL1_9PEZI|nr:hypothetical protein VPNG_09724 [Cytospora leucostoma]